MLSHTAAVIGAGSPPDADQPGFSIGYAHGAGYTELDDVDLVAVADRVPEFAARFADRFGIPTNRTYTDHVTLIEDVRPDIVSVCTPPETHRDLVVSCARAGVPAIHCEKPMALRWDDCQTMVTECTRHDVQLTINHQRRFVPRWRTPADLVQDGAIGTVRRIELAAPDLLDWGTHCFDLSGWYAGDVPATWTFGQIGPAVMDRYGGAYEHANETGAFATWAYENGIRGLAATGEYTGLVGGDVYHRIIGTDGRIEIDGHGDVTLIRTGGAPETIGLEQAQNGFAGAIADAIAALESAREPALAGHRALHATELIFGIWESARRRDRVGFPLEISGNPLEDMIESGTLPVRSGSS